MLNPKSLLLTLCALPLIANAQLTPIERKGLEQTLYIGNLTLRDLDFARNSVTPRFNMPLLSLAIAKPLEAADRLMSLHSEALTLTPSRMLGLIRKSACADPSGEKFGIISANDKLPDSIPARIRGPVLELLRSMNFSNLLVKAALQNLSSEERRMLIESLPHWLAQPASPVITFARSKPAQTAEILNALRKVDLIRIREASEILLLGVDRATEKLRPIAGKLKGRHVFTRSGIKVVLGGSGDDRHTDRDATLTIDFGGSDRYTGRHGAGVGFCSVVMDLEGNDTYDLQDANLGAGLLGVGIAYDLSGDDVYRGRSVSLGSGIAGVGVLYNEGGHDSYWSAALSQGFGAFGVGLLIDTVGGDRYEATCYAQGSARTQGVGWVVDRSGGDTYRLPGETVADALLPGVGRSFGQGFGGGVDYGLDGLGGGAGLVSDGGGDDLYFGSLYAQAVGQGRGLGSVYEGAGRDTYTAHHYAQSAGLGGAAYLFDLAGDDGYAAKSGAAQGLAHDFGVAFLLDRAGDDLYASHDGRPASANASGLSLFMECGGDDRYAATPGAAFGSSGSGALAVFAELGGQDQYSSGVSEALFGAAGEWAVTGDLEMGRVDSGPSPRRTLPTPGSVAKPSEAVLEDLYRSDSRESLDRLVAIGMPALEWILAKKLSEEPRIQTLSALVTAIGAPARNAIAQKVESASPSEVRAALAVVTELRIEEARLSLSAAFDRPAAMIWAARAAAALRATEIVSRLLAMAGSPDALAAAEALIAMRTMSDTQTIGTAQALMTSGDLRVRKAALALMSRFPSEALEVAKRFVSGSDERTARIGVELLGAVGNANALDEAGKALSDGRPGVRIQALLALAGRAPSSYRQRMIDLRDDPHSAVRAVAQGLTDFGR